MNEIKMKKFRAMMDIQSTVMAEYFRLIEKIRSDKMLSCMVAGINRDECATLINLGLIQAAQEYIENDVSEKIFDKTAIMDEA